MLSRHHRQAALGRQQLPRPVRRKASKELGQDQRASVAAESVKSEGPGPPAAAAGSGKKKKSRRISLKDAAPTEAKRLKLSLAGIHKH